jgi:predicted restriction endonuclease
LPKECVICGWSEASIDVCHIIPKNCGGTDTFDNVVVLCPNHHRMFDNGLISKDLLNKKAVEKINLLPPSLLQAMPQALLFRSSNQFLVKSS